RGGPGGARAAGVEDPGHGAARGRGGERVGERRGHHLLDGEGRLLRGERSGSEQDEREMSEELDHGEKLLGTAGSCIGGGLSLSLLREATEPVILSAAGAKDPLSSNRSFARARAARSLRMTALPLSCTASFDSATSA